MLLRRLRRLLAPLLLPFALLIAGCGSGVHFDPLRSYTLTGDVAPVRDPSIIHVGGMYYVFSTDISSPGTRHIPIRCSTDMVAWTACGYVFNQMPTWVSTIYPTIGDIWAPDISYFNGQYHLYYAVSVYGSNYSAVGLATNATLDQNDPNYKWVDQGEMFYSDPNVTWNAIDPNIYIDTDNKVWMTFGSYLTGIYQHEIDPATGRFTSDGALINVAARPAVVNHPIEGASLIHHGNYYYLFVSVDYCCTSDPRDSSYKEAMGRSTSLHGPFLTQDGKAMLDGNYDVMISGDGNWSGTGGGTVYNDPASGQTVIAFHGLNLQQNGLAQLWIKPFVWQNDWPLLQDPVTGLTGQ